jgi:hypothetical protein
MPERKWKGKGLQERPVDVFDLATEAPAIFEAMAKCRGPDGDRAQRAAALAAFRQTEIAPDLAEALDQWLITYDRVTASREGVAAGDPSAMERLVCMAEDLGAMTERLWWRFGAVHGLDRSAEDLGLTGRSVRLGQKVGARMTNAAHSPNRASRFARMAMLTQTLGVEKAARQCEAEGLGNWQAIQRQWNRFKDKNQDT